MSKNLFILFLLLPGFCSALPRGHKKAKHVDSAVVEPLTRKQVYAISDSIMNDYMGNLITACTYNKKGYYSYIDPAKDSTLHWAMLSKHKKIKGILKNVFMSYKFDLDYSKCTAYSKITGTIFLKLDSDLVSRTKPDMSFIPDFVWNNTDCRLVTEDKVIELAYNFGFKEGTGLKTFIQYDKPVKQFYWNIVNRIPQDSTIQKRFVTQTMQINAYTRKKILYTKTQHQDGVQH